MRTQFNPKYKGESGEKNTLQSVTRPDDCLTLKQLLLNHTRNISSNVRVRPGIYTGDTIIPNHQDITDEVEHKENLKKQNKELQEKAIKEYEEKDKEEKARIIASQTDNSKSEKSQTGTDSQTQPEPDKT